MNNVVDEILQDDPKFRIIDDEGNIIYDNISIEMITAINQIGTALNKALFDSIKTDLNSRLLTSNKATQAEAEAGTNNTKYMTPLRVKQALKVNKIVKTKYTLSTSASTTIDLTPFFTTDTVKLEVMINAYFYGTAAADTSIQGTDITANYEVSPTTEIKLGERPGRGSCLITIYPKINMLHIKSKFDSQRGSSYEITIDDLYSYATLTNLVVGRMRKFVISF